MARGRTAVLQTSRELAFVCISTAWLDHLGFPCLGSHQYSEQHLEIVPLALRSMYMEVQVGGAGAVVASA
jgi:hypothetical protein